MKFSEKHHAHISAQFYRTLLKKCTQNGEATFILAIQKYGEQRGSRMAQRAIRDGRKLDFAAYCAYGELSYTDDYYLSDKHIKEISKSPDYRYLAYACPWHEEFNKMNAKDAAIVYCSHLDKALVRGFNPYLEFEVKSTLHEHDKCDFVMKGANLEKTGYSLDDAQTLMSFDYHCGHLYKTFSEIVKSIHGKLGEEICEIVSCNFEKDFGTEMKEILLSYQDTDFNVLPTE